MLTTVFAQLTKLLSRMWETAKSMEKTNMVKSYTMHKVYAKFIGAGKHSTGDIPVQRHSPTI